MYTLVNFYHFFDLTHPAELRARLLGKGKEAGLKGTILLASEGINCAIQGTEKSVEEYIHFLKTLLPELSGALIKKSYADKNAFNRFKVIVKKEIVTLGKPSIFPHKGMGKLVEPDEWNALLKDENTFFIDTRNDYEIKVGTFPRAVSPHTNHFRDFVSYIKTHKENLKDKKLALYCTGGIRCEKATAYLMQEEGFVEVYQLKGGILNYLEKTSPQENNWKGDLFLFDDRCAIDSQLRPQDYFFCRSCGDISPRSEGKPHPSRPGLACKACHTPLSPA